jgi:O-methyltransferase involved in polyketide biosynthesis
VDTLVTARFEMESIGIVDKGCHPDERALAFSAFAAQVVPGESPRDDMKEAEPCDGILPDLAGVSETMLWSLHNRASEARRPDGVLVDPESVHIRSAINYDFARHFGDPLGSLAARAVEIDRALRSWLDRHPEGIVVSLGEGLETQGRRVDNGRMRWLSVDLPDAIRLRERFLAPTHRFRHIAASALDPAWMDAVDPSSGVFIVAQGLLMYLAPGRVRQLFASIADRFPGSELVFDAIPRWFSHLTLLGLNQTASYRLPSMPWGIDRDEIEPTLRRWHPRVATVAFLSYQSPRGLPRLFAEMTNQIPIARHGVPSLVHVAIANAVGQSNMTTAIAGEIASELGIAEESPHFRTCRKPNMTAMNDHDSTVDGMGGFLAAATQNATCSGDIAIATTQVIAKRVKLGMAAAFNPLRADRAEFSRMVPEKVEAFSTASMIMLKQSGQANRQMMRFASDEVMTTALGTIEMTGCSSPIALAEAQSRFARAWFDRATSIWIAMGSWAFGAQSAAMAPIRQTVVANAERLGR